MKTIAAIKGAIIKNLLKNVVAFSVLSSITCQGSIHNKKQTTAKEAVPKGAHFKERLGFPEGYEIDIAVLLGFAENPGGKPHELDMDKLSFVE